MCFVIVSTNSVIGDCAAFSLLSLPLFLFLSTFLSHKYVSVQFNENWGILVFVYLLAIAEAPETIGESMVNTWKL